MSRNSNHEESKPLLSRSNFEDSAPISVQVYRSYTEACIVDRSITDPNCRPGNHEEKNKTQCPSGSTDNEINKEIDEDMLAIQAI